MILLNDFCHVCGNIVDFEISESATLFREAKCPICGASLRNSDMAKMILKNIAPDYTSLRELPNEISKDFQMLNTCSSGSLHNSLGKLKGYLASEFFGDVANGDKKNGVYCVDLCDIPFGDEVFDLVISEDVFEHISDYHRAFQEIYRVLKPGGCHIFTVPVHEGRKTVSRIGNEKVIHHGDPLDEANGCVVVTDFGDDLIDLLNSMNYSCKKYLLHKFYEPTEITNCDFTYDEYLKKREKLEDYFKYNSIVIVAKKDKQMDDIKFTGERFIPGIDDKKLSIEHYQRYKSILPYVRDKVVLDAACGEGYGSNLIAECATSVIGMDIDDYSIERAAKKYATHKNNLKYIQGSIADLSVIETASIDVLVSFETIEHVSEDIQWQFLKEIKRVLKDDGILFMSTPNKKIYSDLYHYTNEFHVKEFYYNEFMDFLKKEFEYVRFFNQSYEVLSLLVDVSTPKTCVNYESELEINGEAAKYFVVVASNKNILEYNLSSAILYDDKEYDNYINRILKLQDEVEEKNAHIVNLDKIIAEQNEKKEENNAIKEENNAIKEEINNLKIDNRNKQGHIELLLESEREYEHFKSTKAYKLVKIIQKTCDFILPINSKRRFFVRIIYNFLCHPKMMCKFLNLKRIKSFIKYIKLEGMEGVNRRYQEAKELEEIKHNPDKLLKYDIEFNDKKVLDVSDFEKLVLPQCSNPQVSIIIPVYNEFEYTYKCINSIIRNTRDVAYEVIVANDCSTDITRFIDTIIENIKLITTESNVRFLLNCNNAAKYAKGDYILFLNNDTQVQSNWLQPLVSLIERNEKNGMVGSKLVYPDGTLQEAGGIIWNDASAWNYGNRCNPNEPEFNYVKEVDYISGAAIMIRRALWEEIGGFDTKFAPAYYEDVDLAFEVRKRGYRVLFQPQSVVVHFEGISNGTDVTEGVKHFQQENQKKFLEKWHDELKEYHQSNGQNVFGARDRSLKQKHILVIDHYVPEFDKDAGGRGTFMYLNLFRDLGFHVTFLGDNFNRSEPYSTILMQCGIEILYGAKYANNIQHWIKQNGNNFDYIYLQRPHISVKYMDLVKKYSNAKIIYYDVDLHHVRELRQYEVTRDKALLSSAKKWKKIEFDLIEKADVVHVVGSYEESYLKKEFPNKPIRNIPLYIYPELKQNVNKNFEERENLLFVGGFGHPPNENAVLWFAKNVYPQILSKFPKMKWIIVGSKPPKSVQELECENIIIKGFIPDDELNELYSTCRMAVVPLQYGAGVKGKVLEAMYNQIPLVTTSVGAEGLSKAEESFWIADNADEMTKVIIDNYNDFNALFKMSENCKKFIQNHFMIEEARRILEFDFELGEKIE